MESDQELLQSINQGDAQAFEQLYLRYRDRVYALAFRFTGNEQDALDVLQETFFYLLGKVHGLKLTATMTTYLYPVVKHLSQAARRKRCRAQGGAETLSELPAPQAAETAPSELAAVVAVLSAAQREVLLMRFVDDMKLDEIARALGIPVGTVKSRLHEALRTLREDRRTREYFLG